MRELLNKYLNENGLNGLYVEEYSAVMQLIYQSCKVDAIKKLRECSATNSIVRLQFASNNNFSDYVEAKGLGVFEDSKRLGLKEAKDVVDYLILNLDQIKRMPQ